MSGDTNVDFYESSPEFVRVWADSRLTISSALWQGCLDLDLDRAQEQKLNLMADLADFKPGGKVLDIGCGYGGLLTFAVDERKVGHALGITTSASQAGHVKSLGNPAVEVSDCDFWDLPVETAGFDSVVAVQSLEHVLAGAPADCGSDPKAMREMLRRIHAWTVPGGRFAAEVCVAGPAETRDDLHEQLDAEVLRNSRQAIMPRLGDLLNAGSGLWEPVSIVTQHEDMLRTLEAAGSRLSEREQEARAIGGDRLYQATCETVRGTTAAVRGGIMRIAWISWKRID
ncbi:SAM-dependent methyltransferase [Kitasatospora sp. NBC_01302]|uniref:SAM-dependent methyltransferase n=1 Tax=Kitasatospora sp. NBC_01302 TaxID=2903575 RepID=UPI002E0D6C5D|nr:class I SAM-dependent methyltransferase [Kitasatospora sp. NBC_01302]